MWPNPGAAGTPAGIVSPTVEPLRFQLTDRRRASSRFMGMKTDQSRSSGKIHAEICHFSVAFMKIGFMAFSNTHLLINF